MPKFRKKPIVIEAVQFFGFQSISEISFLFDGERSFNYDPNSKCLLIETLEGVMQASLNDWIIKGIKGECYPCRDDIFRETYELVEE